MIEGKFKKWILYEIQDGCYEIDDLKVCLDSDDDETEKIWDNFYVYHRGEIMEIIKTQIKAILKKHKTK